MPGGVVVRPPRARGVVALFLLLLVLGCAPLALASFACPGGLLLACARLPERTLSPSAPVLVRYRARTANFSGRVLLSGRKLAFSPDPAPKQPYLGVIRVPKGGKFLVKVKNEFTEPLNLHPHGLHVTGLNGDDPSIEILPGASYTYQYSLPKNHPGGTHFIHPHVHMHGVAAISGLALGMVIVNDDANDREVPREIRLAEYFCMILQRHSQAYGTWNAPFPLSFYSVNGIANDPKLEIRKGKWMRLRMTHVEIESPVYGPAITSWTVPLGTTCTFVLIALDGIYLKRPRELPQSANGTVIMEFTASTRADVMVRCSGTDTDVLIPVRAKVNNYVSIPIFSLLLRERKSGERADAFDVTQYEACRPTYLRDTFNDTVTNATRFSITQTLQYNGTSQAVALKTFNLSDTIELDFQSAHPWHMHVNHMQILQSDSWLKRGDWVDTYHPKLVLPTNQSPVRMRLHRFSGFMVVHCHNIVHQDVQGMMGIFWILPASVSEADEPFSRSCPTKVALTTLAPSRKPTSSKPTRKPTSRRPTTGRPTTLRPTTLQPTPVSTFAPTSSAPTNTRIPTRKATRFPTKKPTRRPIK